MVRRASNKTSFFLVGIFTLVAGCQYYAGMHLYDMPSNVPTDHAISIGAEAAIALNSHDRFSDEIAAGDTSLMLRISAATFTSDAAGEDNINILGFWLQGETSFNPLIVSKSGNSVLRPFVRYGVGRVLSVVEDANDSTYFGTGWQADFGLELSVLRTLGVYVSYGTQTLDLQAGDLVTNPFSAGVSLYF